MQYEVIKKAKKDFEYVKHRGLFMTLSYIYYGGFCKNGTKYLRVDQVKFLEDSLEEERRNLKGYGLLIPSDFLKFVFHKFYLDHS